MKMHLQIILKSLKYAQYVMRKLIDKGWFNKYYYKALSNLIDDIKKDYDM